MCLVWTPNTEAHSSRRWLLYETWRQQDYLFISVLAWRFHGPILILFFCPRECCRRNRFLFTSIKLIFFGVRANGQNTNPQLFFFPPQPGAITQQAAFLFASFWAIKDKLSYSCYFPASLSHGGLKSFLWGLDDNTYIFLCLLTSLNVTGLEESFWNDSSLPTRGYNSALIKFFPVCLQLLETHRDA